jgi:dihydrofolate reductase
MDAYWPTAADNPKASPHDIEHGTWYNQVQKIVISRYLKGKQLKNAIVMSENISEQVLGLKQREGKEIVMFGSPTAAQVLMNDNLVDDYWFFINPIILGGGISMFGDIKDRLKLKLVESIPFASGVICLHYEKL